MGKIKPSYKFSHWIGVVYQTNVSSGWLFEHHNRGEIMLSSIRYNYYAIDFRSDFIFKNNLKVNWFFSDNNYYYLPIVKCAVCVLINSFKM